MTIEQRDSFLNGLWKRTKTIDPGYEATLYATTENGIKNKAALRVLSPDLIFFTIVENYNSGERPNIRYVTLKKEDINLMRLSKLSFWRALTNSKSEYVWTPTSSVRRR